MVSFPIDVAVEYGLSWDAGTRKIFEKTNSREKLLETPDASTGLCPFMMAAASVVDGGNYHGGYDLDTIFNLMKESPHLVKKF